MIDKPTRVLVGDDQIGIEGSMHNQGFLRNYGKLNAKYDFESNPERFIERAKVGRYDTLLIDLNWKDVDSERGYKTGYMILKAVRDYAPVRLLYTSEDTDSRVRGLNYGATRCVEKHKSSSYLEKALKGGEE